MKNEAFEAALAAFLVAAQALCDASGSYSYTKLSMQYGRRYVRIVAERSGQQSVWGFVDTTNGNVLKAASWKAPATKYARGCIYDENRGCGRARWMGVA